MIGKPMKPKRRTPTSINVAKKQISNAEIISILRKTKKKLSKLSNPK